MRECESWILGFDPNHKGRGGTAHYMCVGNTARNVLDSQNWRHVLASQGIAAHQRGEHVFGFPNFLIPSRPFGYDQV